MTVAATVRKAGPTVGNSLATVFPFAYKVFAATDLQVVLTTIASGAQSTLVLNDPAGYTVALNADQNANPGGSVTYNPSGVPLPNTQSLTIISIVPQVQGTHILNGGAFFANNVEDALDKNTIIVQDLAAKVASAVQFPPSDSAALNAVLPVAASRANLVLGFDASGNVIVTSGGSNIPIAAAMVPVVQAATLALGRAALGLSAYFDSLVSAATKAALTALFTPLTTKGDLWGFAAADARVAVGADGKVLSADSTQASGLSYVDSPARPNLLINPNWQFDQINEGALYTINGAAANGPDGWSGEAVGGGGGVFKLRTLADPDNAALKCLEITCTTADVAIAAAERYSIFTAVEGYDAAALLIGTASAQQIIVQFKFKSNVNGVYGVSIANSAKNRSYVGIITVADANEHEYTVTLTLDTAGTWLYTNGVGLYMRLTLAGGANFQAAAGAWNAADNYCTAAQCNFMAANTSVAYLKRIQLLTGSTVQAYKPADIQKELTKAQRYYGKSYSIGVVPGTVTDVGRALLVNLTFGNVGSNVFFKASMRAAPTLTAYNTVTGAAGNIRDLTTGADGAGNTTDVGTEQGRVITGFGVANDVYAFHWTANARLA